MLFTACEDDYDKLVKEPNDITLNELQLEKFTHVIPDGGFKSGGIQTELLADSHIPTEVIVHLLGVALMRP